MAIVPYLVGFTPKASLVCLGVRGMKVVFAVRADLPPAGSTASDIQNLVDDVTRVIGRQGLTSVIAVGYGTAEQADPVLVQAASTITSIGLPVADLLRVAGNQFFIYQPDQPDAPPRHGGRLTIDDSVMAAHATVAGLVALPNRATLAAQLEPLDEAARHAMAQVVDDVHDQMSIRLAETVKHRMTENDEPTPARSWIAAADEVIQQWGRQTANEAISQYEHGDRLNDHDAARLLLLLHHPRVREHAWEHIRPTPEHLRMWIDLTRRAPTPLVPAPASLLAFTAWRLGNGALANVAINRALTADPRYPFAHALHELLRSGLPPGDWDDESGSDPD
ncbi:DUF4192 domain-containing protein [Phytohabitans sp. LJ34]|uniref:DUF4192 domain-containing protein n=1 Tax=Phytohabitans sp. LJ34 TaxID=3452217 RepID=UPI003F8CB0F1